MQRQEVDQFFSATAIAVVGVSAQKQKFGSYAYQALRANGYPVFAVNPALDQVAGEPCYPSVADIPQPVQSVLICIPGEKCETVVRGFPENSVRSIWFQQGIKAGTAEQYCREKGMSVIRDECVLMYAEPVSGPHRVHRFIWKLIGRYTR
jgi:predicted CoA-binding protein